MNKFNKKFLLIIFTLILIISICGCSKSNINEAYSIRDNNLTESSSAVKGTTTSETKKSTESNTTSAMFNPIDITYQTILNSEQSCTFNDYTLTIEDVLVTNTIFDASKLLNDKELYNSLINLIVNYWDRNHESLNTDGTWGKNTNRSFVFIKMKIKNESSKTRKQYIYPFFYKISNKICYRADMFSCEIANKNTDLSNDRDHLNYTFSPYEEFETVLFCLADKDLVQTANIYMTAGFLCDTVQDTSKLPAMCYLLPVFINNTTN